MTDKPIPAEIVTSDQIRVGDRIVYRGKEYTIELVEDFEDEYGVAWISTKFTTLSDFNHFDFHPGSLVARILPEPVEVRDQWLSSTLKTGWSSSYPPPTGITLLKWRRRSRVASRFCAKDCPSSVGKRCDRERRT